jgi:hypothetical protein
MDLRWFIICVMLSGCVHSQAGGQHHNRTIKGLEIYSDGTPYAKLILIGQKAICCRGIAIKYLETGKSEWLSPKNGWQLKKDGVVYDKIEDVDREWGPTHFPNGTPLRNYHGVSSDSFGKLMRRCNVRLSGDGSEVLFEKSSLFGNVHDTIRIP